MRAALWLLALFGIAAAVALFAGNNQGTITVFWPPWRVDLSLNLVLLLLAGTFVLLYAALRALAALFSLPQQARQWRVQQKERALHTALLDAMVQLMAGRFSRARRAAMAALAQERALEALDVALPQARQLRVLSHLLAAESAQSLQDRAARDAHLQQALNESAERGVLSPETREGVQLRSARWALEDHDPSAALARLKELPQGVQRRTLALRLHLKAARQERRTLEALQTARLLAKHRAFSEAAAQSIVRGLAMELLSGAHDAAQLIRAWADLEAGEREMPEVAIHAAQRMVALHGDLAVARGWLLPVWEFMVRHPDGLVGSLRVKLVRALEAGLASVDADWLARIESAQRGNPRDANLLYLAGMVCMKRQLWGKAQQLLMQAGMALQDVSLYRSAWRALAQLAEARDDASEAMAAWKRAAQTEDL
ncbi:heme biosynthesis protein HemY [Variovorax arabinosiphilus]|uniref:heme biosynthesis protein HemY n=1 Tax=Variovorax arabinosiphilus TaxID=3053498 RepID=UPI0025752FEB|nr:MULTISPECIES: heme biosynthesis HemY N-terminal domain-containing protein [unclassified Variovorax]MDM0123125.1 heme biosynthesis HemY N-terminal domain-containing protein [Variovorax sp. J2L1-78]MDM0131879.1 heme biosynthesis HemY N-terminal domain-containing protein [Variovorax sp. J2L1-63]MDM0235888.1 heme biosynthesis HemY N-terminal domain-containing protein [Variovorax sp. J2R1-6]